MAPAARTVPAGSRDSSSRSEAAATRRLRSAARLASSMSVDVPDPATDGARPVVRRDAPDDVPAAGPIRPHEPDRLVERLAHRERVLPRLGEPRPVVDMDEAREVDGQAVRAAATPIARIPGAFGAGVLPPARVFTASRRPWASATQAMTGSDSTSWRDRRAASRASRSARIRAVMSWKALIACVGVPLGSSSGLARTIDQRSSPVARDAKRTVTGGGCSPVSARTTGQRRQGQRRAVLGEQLEPADHLAGRRRDERRRIGEADELGRGGVRVHDAPVGGLDGDPVRDRVEHGTQPHLERADADPRCQPLLDHVSWSPLA